MICKENRIYEKSDTSIIKRLIKTLALGIILCVVFIFIISLVITYTDVSENIINPSVNILRLITILICSIVFTFGERTKGWLKGLISGGAFCTVICLAGIIFIDDYTTLANPLKLLTEGAILGMTGGIIGINLKSGKNN